jgi:hypothetical protein
MVITIIEPIEKIVAKPDHGKILEALADLTRVMEDIKQTQDLQWKLFSSTCEAVKNQEVKNK